MLGGGGEDDEEGDSVRNQDEVATGTDQTWSDVLVSEVIPWHISEQPIRFFLWNIRSSAAIAKVCKQQENSYHPRFSIEREHRGALLMGIQLILDRHNSIVPLFGT